MSVKISKTDFLRVRFAEYASESNVYFENNKIYNGVYVKEVLK